MERPQNRTKVLHLLQPLFHPFLVAIKTSHIESVRTTYVEVPIAVEIAQFRTLRFCQHRAETEFLAHHPRERKGHPIGVGETQIREATSEIIAPGDRFRAVGLKEAG